MLIYWKHICTEVLEVKTQIWVNVDNHVFHLLLHYLYAILEKSRSHFILKGPDL